jgi:uncharacterized protein (TIGR02453 family)
MDFSGWPETAQRFFIGLQLDNSRRYFEANKQVYLRDVRGPMEALSADLEKIVGPGHIFRVNRDVRFSRDKSPYKANVSAWWADRGGELYVHLDARDFYVWAGKHDLQGASLLESYRRSVDDEELGPSLEGIVAGVERKGYEVGGESLKRVPHGFRSDHPRARFLRHKSIGISRSHGLQPWLGTPEAKDRVLEVWRDAAPLVTWLRAALAAPAAR